MAISTKQQLRVALSSDLNRAEPKAFAKVIDDAARKTFTTRKEGAVFEFSHKQPDSNFWNGLKYYGSGGRSRIRIKRTQDEPALNKEQGDKPLKSRSKLS